MSKPSLEGTAKYFWCAILSFVDAVVRKVGHYEIKIHDFGAGKKR
jgi:hypothetical protein